MHHKTEKNRNIFIFVVVEFVKWAELPPRHEARGEQSLINLTLNLNAAWHERNRNPKPDWNWTVKQRRTPHVNLFRLSVQVTFFWVFFVVALLAGKFWIMIKSKKLNSIAADWRGNPYRVGVPKMDKHRVILMAAHAMYYIHMYVCMLYTIWYIHTI